MSTLSLFLQMDKPLLVAVMIKQLNFGIWQPDKEIYSLKGHSGWIWNIAFAPDSKTLASASKDKTIKLWNLATGTRNPHSEGSY